MKPRRPLPLRRAAVLGACWVLGGCRDNATPTVEVVAGPKPTDRSSFTPKSAFFEYLELPGQRNELELTLASYEVSCERYVPPSDGETSVRVVVVTPAGVPAAPGNYPFAATDEAQSSAPKLDQARAVPKSFIGKRSQLFQPGGGIQLTKVLLDREGMLEGTLAFEFAGNAAHTATSIKGRFRARMCRLDRGQSK